jgi:hypothetical protein
VGGAVLPLLQVFSRVIIAFLYNEWLQLFPPLDGGS